MRQALEAEGRGRVLVVDGGGSLRTALVGGSLAALAREERVDRPRDSRLRPGYGRARGTAVGVRALGSSPMRSARDGEGGAGVPVTFARGRLRPGHWLYADGDGMIVADGAPPAAD